MLAAGMIEALVVPTRVGVYCVEVAMERPSAEMLAVALDDLETQVRARLDCLPCYILLDRIDEQRGLDQLLRAIG